MAEVEKKKTQQAVYFATYEHILSGRDENESPNRYLTVIAPHFQRAAFKAVKNTMDGETLVSLTKQNDAVV